MLFDTESVVVDAVEELRSGELSDRCEIVSGDAREAVPEEGDAYLLSAVLHNWNDETCVRILSRCARAARPGARILIFEVLLDEAGEWSMMEAVSDPGMFVLFGARERSEGDFARLFEESGLDYAGRVKASSSFHLLEARMPARS